MPEMFSASSLSAAQKRELAALKRPVSTIVAAFSGVRERVKDIAPKVVRFFNQIKADVPEGVAFGLADFARLFDASVPTHAADKDGEPGYRQHKMYYTLDYMRRVVSGAGRPRGQQGRRDPAADQLARLLATVLQVVKDADPIWRAVGQEFGLQARGIARLKARVEDAKPIIDLSGAMKPVNVGADKIVHVERAKPGSASVTDMQAALAGLQARTGRKRAA